MIFVVHVENFPICYFRAKHDFTLITFLLMMASDTLCRKKENDTQTTTTIHTSKKGNGIAFSTKHVLLFDKIGAKNVGWLKARL